VSLSWPWVSLILLGAYHGLNPAMGWLFAVALGLQEQSRTALLQALVPIALGHAAAVAVTVVLIGSLQAVTSLGVLRAAVAAVLIGFGLWKLLTPRSHPRWVGMRVTLPELALWSFLMSSAHGAGLMLVPVMFHFPAVAHGQHAGSVVSGEALAQGSAAVAVHALAMWLVMSAVAIAVYEKVGLAVLRRGWVNLDALWAMAFIVAGVFTLVS
jgi:hypothetical protein